ncbi:hypothetical protein PRIPAC_86051 [Pristionchus pacificus]|uniref:Uncharacterized protein n=1 Tax=Pristionchus pacificus TaxID=54126 RepID=A0A2A6BT30_PRIPA|nr:hypothetical protein PRIPAC_86051 [Pristionchus pacificus]|eukprot:PDM69048.1 hypothetical protein PRIPAC_47350 [Pristionchus pacificus]
MNSSLPYGFHIDRDFLVPFYFRFLTIYGYVILIVHSVAFYLLIFHTKAWVRSVRAGYLLNQAQMLLHDVWVCFVFRAYTLQPYPILILNSSLAALIGGPNAYIIENVFMLHAVCILLFMLLMMHQQIMPRTSKIVLPRWRVDSISDPSNKAEILQRAELTWTRDYIYDVVILGDLGRCSNYTYILLVVSSVRFLKKQVLITANATRMKRLIIEVLTKQTACVSAFYIYPVLLYAITCEFQLAFLPDLALAFVRIAFVAFLGVIHAQQLRTIRYIVVNEYAVSEGTFIDYIDS